MSACSGVGIEFFERPYRYDRFPFRLSVGELVPFSGVYYSQPAFAALTDKRLFTAAASHPVTSPLKLYINQVAGVTIDELEPDPDAVGYESGCINYTDYITDIRDVLEDVFTLHAADSEHDATAFKISHLQRQRAVYGNLDNTSASGTLDTEYIHELSTLTIPSGGELGASGMEDVDMDEIMYQPFARPTKRRTTDIVNSRDIPTQPFFPTVIKSDGTIPAFGTKDVEIYSELGLDVSSSGNALLITGDRLLANASIKAISEGSGSSVAATGDYIRSIEWALYPAQDQMCNYLEPSGSVSGGGPLITASGRQALFDPPLLTEGVYLTAVSEDTATSGNQIQHYPSDWESPSGIKSDKTTHEGLYVEDTLIFAISEMAPGQAVVGRSKQNGRKVFAHVAGDESGPLGNTLGGGTLSFAFNDSVYTFGGITSFVDTQFGNPEEGNPAGVRTHQLTWQTADKTLSPASEATGTAQELGASQGFHSMHPGSANGKAFGCMLTYILGGYIDIWVITDSPTSLPGASVETITYTTRTFRSSNGGAFTEEPGSPQIRNRTWVYYPNSWDMENFFSFFLQRNGYRGLVNFNGEVMFQFGKPLGIAREGRLLTRPTAYNTTTYPPTSYSKSCYAIGFFPNWAIICNITTNNQFTNVPTTLNWTGIQIVNAAGFTEFTNNDVKLYGPPVWDENTGINYMYVQLTDDRYFFCKVNTSAEIFEANQVNGEDAIMFGPIGILSL